MAFTPLYVVQKVLNDMNSFPVNSLSDTEEALQVASILEDKFYEIQEKLDWPVNSDYTQLDSSAIADGPTTLKIPDTVDSINNLRYNSLPLRHVTPEVFLDTVLDPTMEDNENAEYVSMGPNVQGWVLNNKNPEYFTTFDDDILVCDSYDLELESKLVTSKTLAQVSKHVRLILDDTTPIPITKKMEPYFLTEVKAACFKKIKQQVSDEDERERRIQKSRLNSDAKKQQDNDKRSQNQGFGRSSRSRAGSSASWWTETND